MDRQAVEIAAVITDPDGRVRGLSRTARRRFGDRPGDMCWDVMGEVLEDAPCHDGCAVDLSRSECVQEAEVLLHGPRCKRVCRPHGSVTACLLAVKSSPI